MIASIKLFDDDKFYYIVGRKSRIIKLYGNRFNLDDIEEQLLKKNIYDSHIKHTFENDFIKECIIDLLDKLYSKLIHF